MTEVEKLFTKEFKRAFVEFKKTNQEITKDKFKYFLEHDYPHFKDWLHPYVDIGWKIVHGTYKYSK